MPYTTTTEDPANAKKVKVVKGLLEVSTTFCISQETGVVCSDCGDDIKLNYVLVYYKSDVPLDPHNPDEKEEPEEWVFHPKCYVNKVYADISVCKDLARKERKSSSK